MTDLTPQQKAQVHQLLADDIHCGIDNLVCAIERLRVAAAVGLPDGTDAENHRATDLILLVVVERMRQVVEHLRGA
jgi:hypothetical protein